MNDQAIVRSIDVIVCVHNAPQSVARCLESLELHLPRQGCLIVVDDGSDGPTRDLLSRWQRRLARMGLLRNEVAQGYTRAANRGLRSSSADLVILLNSDTVVTSGWADRIADVFATDQSLGIVGPLSNAASWQSLPETRTEDGSWVANDLPLGVDLEDLAGIVSARIPGPFPRLPVINGFCFGIHRRVIDRIGLLDEGTFPVGYGEETDYCIRAAEAGFQLGVADHAFVYHEKSSSFGHERRLVLSRAGWEALKAKHGSALLGRIMEEAAANASLPARRATILKAVGALQRDRRESASAPAAALSPEPVGYHKFLDEYTRIVALLRRPALDARIYVLVSELDSAADVRRTVGSIEQLRGIGCTVVGDAAVLAEAGRTGAVLEGCPPGSSVLSRLTTLIEKQNESAVMFAAAGAVVRRDCLTALARLADPVDAHVAACTFDEDLVDPSGARSQPALKPILSPCLLAESGYAGHAAWFRRESLLQIGLDQSLPTLFVSALLLDAWRRGWQVAHSAVLGVSRGASLFHAVTDNESRRLRCRLLSDRAEGERLARASIIIPFRGKPELLRCCVGSLLALTSGIDFEVLLVDNASNDQETEVALAELSRDPRVRVLRDPRAFNYSAINNLAAAQATGNVLVFLNNDTEILHPEWLSEMCELAVGQGVGAVGALLFFPDGTVQHAGVALGFRGLAGHVFSGMHEHDLPALWRRYRREASAVTGACMAVLRERFEQVGGFDECFEVTGSDVELCLRLARHGYRSIFTPHARLVHHERKTRRPMPVRAVDLQLSLRHYEPWLSQGDPWLNRWFSRSGPGLELCSSSDLQVRRFVGEAKGRLQAIGREREGRALKVSQLAGSLASRRKLPGDAEVTVYDASIPEMAANRDLLLGAPESLSLQTATWFIPYFDLILRGGIYTIFRIADHLSRTRGARNTIVIYGRSKRTATEIATEISSAFPLLRFEVMLLPSLDDVHAVPPSEIGICTLWNSAYYLLRYNACLAKFYLVQDYEPAFQSAGSVAALVEQTYRFGFKGIANTPGVAALYRRYGSPTLSFTPAVDQGVFHPDPARVAVRPLRIVFYGRPGNARNGFRLGIEALRLAKLAAGDALEIVSVGGDYDPADYGVAGLIRNLGVLRSIDEVSELYRSADIGLVFMFTAHPSYQPFEYMAAGCAVVSNYNEHNLWFLRHRENAILSPPTVSAVAESIVELTEDDALRSRLREEGLRTVAGLDWESELERIASFMESGRQDG